MALCPLHGQVYGDGSTCAICAGRPLSWEAHIYQTKKILHNTILEPSRMLLSGTIRVNAQIPPVDRPVSWGKKPRDPRPRQRGDREGWEICAEQLREKIQTLFERNEIPFHEMKTLDFMDVPYIWKHPEKRTRARKGRR